MALIEDVFRTKKIKVNRIYENKKNGQMILYLPKRKMKTWKSLPKKLEVIGFWEK